MPDKRATGEFYYERQVEEAAVVTGMYSLAASLGKKSYCYSCNTVCPLHVFKNIIIIKYNNIGSEVIEWEFLKLSFVSGHWAICYNFTNCLRKNSLIWL